MISIGTTFNYDINLNEQLPMIRNAGFSHVSLGAKTEHSGYLEKNGQEIIRRMLVLNNLQVCSIHTPFGMEIDISSPRAEITENAIQVYSRCIDAALSLNARVVIFHPTAYRRFDDLEHRKKRIVDNIKRLLDHIDQASLSLAIENESFRPANEILAFSLEVIDDPRYGFCYDSSHDNLVDRPLVLLRDWGRRLLTTHISDNRGKKDDHMLPYEGTFPWKDFCRYFSGIHYNGPFLLEVEMRESAFGSPSEFLREAFNRGQRLLNACRTI